MAASGLFLPHYFWYGLEPGKEFPMIKYVLTSEQARESVDLRNHSQNIFDMICGTLRGRDVDLEAGSDYFVLHTSPAVTEEEFAKIDQMLSYTGLGNYKLEGQPLFTAVECGDQDLGPDTVREDKYTRFLRQMNEQAAKAGIK